jgi:hypothetical protein
MRLARDEFAARSGVKRAVAAADALAVKPISDAAAQPFALEDAAFERGGDTVNVAGVLELGKDAEYPQHRPPPRASRCSWLGRQLQDELELSSPSAGPALRHVPAEPVYAVDEQHIEPGLGSSRAPACSPVDQA